VRRKKFSYKYGIFDTVFFQPYLEIISKYSL